MVRILLGCFLALGFVFNANSALQELPELTEPHVIEDERGIWLKITEPGPLQIPEDKDGLTLVEDEQGNIWIKITRLMP